MAKVVKWEYNVVFVERSSELAPRLESLGLDGWELVWVWRTGRATMCIFKRPL